MDTGAALNYVAASKAQCAGAQVVPISAHEIVGAGSTVTTVFTISTLKIGGMCTKCYTYMLEDSRWDDDSYEITHPEDKTKFYVKPIPAKE